jgi:thiol-disulfide isomerase/thioredoxin
MEKKTIIVFVVVIVLLLGGIFLLTARNNNSTVSNTNLSAFAQCLKTTKTTFFGAFWCPHCQATKRMFGKAAKELPYVECSTPDGRGQNQVCKDKNITNYPTWEFANGERLTGEVTLAQLTERTNCTETGLDTTRPAIVASSTLQNASSSSSSSAAQNATPVTPARTIPLKPF